jgi:hypothetical protein
LIRAYTHLAAFQCHENCHQFVAYALAEETAAFSGQHGCAHDRRRASSQLGNS